MNNDELDPLIRREFEALGMNIVGNDILADLVIDKVRKRRKKFWMLSIALFFAISAITAIGYLVGTNSHLSIASNPSAGNIIMSNSYEQSSKEKNVLSLPQFARINVTQGNAGSHHSSFRFNLHRGEVIEVFTQSKSSTGGVIGSLTVNYVKSDGTSTLLQKNPIGTNVADNEFGNTSETGLYTFNFDITDPSYEGQLLVAFLIGHFE
jgi:hypothetical protein